MNAGRLRIRWRAGRERFRGSLFYVPALYVIGAGALAWGTLWFDRSYARDLPTIPLLLPTTLASARAILSTIAGATITVAGVVFSLTVVAVQLASTQFSPRVLRGFLRDRFSQRVIGIVMATFTYCLLVLAATPTPRVEEEGTVQNVSVTVAVLLAIVAVLAIIAFLDHSARSMQVGEIIRRISDETRELIGDGLRPRSGQPAGRTAADARSSPADLRVVADREGWVQQIDDDALLSALPAAGDLRLWVRVGSYITPATVLAEVWAEGVEDADADSIATAVRAAVATGQERTMQQDLAFGIRQLVDIALRALSPSVNDPTTAIEVVYRLGGLLEEVLVRDLPDRVRTDEEGRRVVRGADLDHDTLVRYAFRQIRLAAADQPAVITKLVRVLGELHDHVQRHGLPDRAGQLAEEGRLAIIYLEDQIDLDEDREPALRTARRFDLADGPSP